MTKLHKVRDGDDGNIRVPCLELLIYMLLVISATIVAVGSRQVYMYYFNNAIRKLFVLSNEVSTVDDWFNYMGSTILPALDTAKDISDAKEEDGDTGVGKLLRENLYLGPPRFRQIRVLRGSCEVHHAFIKYFETCYAEYGSSYEETADNYKGTTYFTLDELDAVSLFAKVGTYWGGGYVQDLTYSSDENIQTLHKLRESKWIDRATRAVILEFTLFNGNTDLFASVKYIVEKPPTGGLIPSWQIQAFKAETFWNEGDPLNLTGAIMFYILILFYTIEQIRGVAKKGCLKYITSLWHIVDLIILLLAYGCLVYTIWHPLYLRDLMDNIPDKITTHESLDIVSRWYMIYIDMMGMCTFFIWVKVFKYLSFNKTMTQFSRTFKRVCSVFDSYPLSVFKHKRLLDDSECAMDLLGFGVMFTVVFLAYAQLGLLLFGMSHDNFRNFSQSFLTMVRMMLGDFDYSTIEDANFCLGPIFFLSFTILVFFILLNMFIAIITETYTEVKYELEQGRTNKQIFVKDKCAKFFVSCFKCGKGGKKSKKNKTEKRRNNEYIASNEDLNESETDETPYPKTSTGPEHAPLHAHESEIIKNFFVEVDMEEENEYMGRLTRRVVLLEDAMEQLIANMDFILKKVESKRRPKKYDEDELD